MTVINKTYFLKLNKYKSMKSLRETVKLNKILIAAHRGDSSNFPENTFAAFKSAVQIGVDMIELDVQFTKDEKIIVTHNETLNSENIFDLTYDQIKDFDNGSWFSKEFSNERIPLLADVLREFGKQIYFSIEIKPFFSEKTQNKLLQLLELLFQNNLSQNVVVASFDTKNLSYLKSKNSEINTAAVFYSPTKNTEKKLLLPVDYKNECGCNAIICSVKELNQQFAENAVQNNIFIGVYGVENKNDVEKCLANNVTVIGTDYCKLIKSIFSNCKENQFHSRPNNFS